MPTKPLDRLMFAQGGVCFFCKKPLSKSEASVEHLVASANGGSNSDDNCVAVCKAVNGLLGSMSLKEKIQVILNQKGQFKCPNGAGSTAAPKKATDQDKSKATTLPKTASTAKQKEDKLSIALANLKQRGNKRPKKLKTLTSTVSSLFPNGISEAELAHLLNQIQASGKVIVSEGNVSYSF